MLCTAYLTTCRNDMMHTLGTNLRFLLNVRCSSGNRWPAWPYFSLSLLSMWPLSAHAVAQWRITFFLLFFVTEEIPITVSWGAPDKETRPTPYHCCS